MAAAGIAREVASFPILGVAMRFSYSPQLLCENLETIRTTRSETRQPEVPLHCRSFWINEDGEGREGEKERARVTLTPRTMMVLTPRLYCYDDATIEYRGLAIRSSWCCCGSRICRCEYQILETVGMALTKSARGSNDPTSYAFHSAERWQNDQVVSSNQSIRRNPHRFQWSTSVFAQVCRRLITYPIDVDKVGHMGQRGKIGHGGI